LILRLLNIADSITEVIVHNEDEMRFEVLRAMKISTVVLWVVIPYTLVGGYQRFGRTYLLHLQGLNEFTTQKITIY
jgi:hypothetical protein